MVNRRETGFTHYITAFENWFHTVCAIIKEMAKPNQEIFCYTMALNPIKEW